MTSAPARHAIRNRLQLSMATTVALGLVLTAVVFALSATTLATLGATTSTINRLDQAAHVLQSSLFAQEAFVFDYALSGRDEAVEEFDAASEEAAAAYADLRALGGAYPAIVEAARVANEAAGEWREEWAEPFLRAAESAAPGPAAVAASEELFVPAEEALVALDGQLEAARAVAATDVEASIPRLAAIVVPLGLGAMLLLGLVGMWLARSISGPLGRLNRTAEALVAGEAVTFRPEGNDELGALAEVLERLRVDAGQRYDVARREAQHAATFNQLAQLTSFAGSELDLVEAAARAVRRLVPTSGGDLLLANPSQNRLTVGVAWGDDAPQQGSLVTIDRIDRCPGIRRAAPFVTGDLADDLAVRCPAHPVATGSLACVPMLALGSVVGVIHLAAEQTDTFDPETVSLVSRVAENVGLAMANARLIKTMEGQAMSDPLTGLRNPRFFDPYLEQELEAARRDEEPLSLLMVDLDHFKQFNDTHGHPAGDEALRTFARVVSGTIRNADVAARYGGEEFIIALRHAGTAEAQAMAERLRLSIEQMIVELGPGRYARITASFGVASTDMHIHDAKALVSMADAALYRAKEAGRNRVELAPTAADVVALNTASRRRLGRATKARLDRADATTS